MLGFPSFKAITRASNRPDQQLLALVMLGSNRHSPLTHEITLTLKPGSKQTIEALLHRLKAYCRKHGGQLLSYVGIATDLPHGHGHFYLSLVKGTRLYDAVMDFVANHAGLDRDEIWFPSGKDDELQLGLMQKLRDDVRHGETGLGGALGKIGYALGHFDKIDGVTPKVEIHASNDYRRLGRHMSEYGLEAEPLEPMLDNETRPAASPITLELKTPTTIPSTFPSLVMGAGVRRARGWDPTLDRADDDAEMIQRLASAAMKGSSFPSLARQ